MFFVKQKTAYEMRISDWSLDVCSSDLGSSMSKRPGGRSVGNGAFIATCCLVGLFRGQGSLAIFPNSHEDNRNWISPSAHPGLPFRLIARMRVVSGKSASIRVDLGGSCFYTKKKQ